MGVYNKNRDNNNSMHDEIREQNRKLKDATLKEKLLYFKDYYLKATIGILLVLILIGSIAKTMITAPKFTAFGALFYNSTNLSDNKEFLEDFINVKNIDTTDADYFLDTSYVYSSEPTNKYNYESILVGIQKSMALMSSKDVDIVVGDQESIDYFAISECFHDVTTILPQDVLEKFKDRLYYYTFEETGKTVPVGIYIGDAPKIIEQQFYHEQDPILGFVVNSERIDTALKFLEYIYE